MSLRTSVTNCLDALQTLSDAGRRRDAAWNSYREAEQVLELSKAAVSAAADSVSDARTALWAIVDELDPPA